MRGRRAVRRMSLSGVSTLFLRDGEEEVLMEPDEDDKHCLVACLPEGHC